MPDTVPPPAAPAASPATYTPDPNDPTDQIRGLILGEPEEQARILAMPPPGEEPPAKPKEEEEVPAAKPKPKPKAKADPSPVPDQPSADATSGKVNQPPEETAPGKPKPARKLSAEELAQLHAETTRDAVVAGVREAVQSVRQPVPEQKAPVDHSKALLPPAVRKNLAALRVLAEIRPDEFKDIEDRAVRFYDQKDGELAKYRKAWEKEHPDEEFDSDAEEHEDWMKDHEPFVAEEDLEGAREEMMRRRMRAEVQSEMEPIRRKLAEQEAEAQSGPMIAQTITGSVKEMVSLLNPGLKDLPEAEVIDKLKEADPVAEVVLKKTAPTFAPLIAETVRIFSGKPYDQNNPQHVQLDRYAQNLEQVLASQPPDKTLIQGPNGEVLRFATRGQLAKLPREQRARYWSVNRDVIVQSLKRDWQMATSSAYQEYRDLLVQLNGGNPLPANVPKSAPAPAAKAAAEEPEEEEVPVRSPGFRSASPAPPPVPKDDPSLQKPGSVFFTAAGW